MIMKKLLIAGLFTMAMAAITGCSSEDDGANSNKDTGTISIRLTDAPFPHNLVAEANVTVFKIDARMKDGVDEEMPSEENDENSPYVVLMEEEIPVNLLELTNGITAELAEAEVPVGEYDLVRVYVRGVNVVLTDGTVYDLKVPSGEQTGIKVFIDPGLRVVGGISSDLLLDFDVSQSFVPKGNFNAAEGISGFNFKPVIKASNMSVAGTLTGKVETSVDGELTALEGAEVSVFENDLLSRTTFTDASGGYSIMGLLEGTYEVEVNLEGYEPAFLENVEIVAGNRTTADFELLALEIPAADAEVIRINSGGPELDAWMADDFFENGSSFSTEVAIANTSIPALYQTERYTNSGTLTYEIPVSDGSYDLNLHFAEIFYGLAGDGSDGGEGSRIFDIDIEGGQQVIEAYDIFVAAGGSATAVVESFPAVVVEDGFLSITLTSVVENAKISGIEVIKL